MADAPTQQRSTTAAPTNSNAPTESRFNRDTQGVGNPFDGKTTTQENLRYPSNLTDYNEYPNWVAFYPLLREGSDNGNAVLKAGGKIFDQSGQNRADPDHALAAGMTEGAIVGAMTGGAAAMSNVSKVLTQKGGKSTLGGAVSGAVEKAGVTAALGLAGGAAGGAVGAGVGAAFYGIGAKRLIFGDKAVVLGIHDKLNFGYSANYDTADLGGVVGAVAAGKTNAAGALDIGGDAGAILARKAAKVAGALGGDRVMALKEATSKTVENPYKEQLFKNMGFRKFGFEYRFSPRNEKEAMEVFANGHKVGGKSKYGILATFAHHMHPETSKGGMFLIYPSEFLIIFYHKGKENTLIRKISNCALTNMTIEYGAEGFTTFQGTDGMPTEAVMRLEFTELETLTNDRIDRGY